MPDPCRACGKPLDPANFPTTADGCPCNSPRGVNHGLVPRDTCTCPECDPEQTGSVRRPLVTNRTLTKETAMADQPKCEVCGEPMPPGEEMFKFHGYSGPCPKPPLPRAKPHGERVEEAAREACAAWRELHDRRAQGATDTNSARLHEAMEQIGRVLNANVS